MLPTTHRLLLLSATTTPLSSLSTTSSPFHPLRLTKTLCLSLLRRCKSLKQAKQIHAQIIHSRLLASSDVAGALLALLTDPKALDLNHAHYLFDTLPRPPSLYLHNLLIKALSKQHLPRRALSLFSAMRSAAVAPDNFTFPFVLKALATVRAASAARAAHALVVKTGYASDPYVRNSLMEMYAELGNLCTAQSLFDEMPHRDVVAWNVLIAVYVRCKRFEDAVAIFRTMRREGVGPDEATLVSTLSACTALRDSELGREIHELYVNAKSRFGVSVSNALLDMYAKCGCVDTARRLFDETVEKNVISWTSMISGYVAVGLLDEAQELFDRSPAKDVVIWTAMINGYVQYNRFEEALAMSREMQMKRIKPDKFTVVSLLTICANLGALEQGKWIHGYVEENRIRIDAVVATALIDMYAKCGSIEKSVEIFKGIEQKDTATWTSVICGLAMNGQTDRALEFFSEMKRNGAEPDDITFIGVLSACSHGGLVEEGRVHFRAMREVHQIEPKVEHYGCLVDLLGRNGLLGEAERLIQSIPNRRDDNVLPLWGALLGACRIYGNVEMGERLARKLSEVEHCNSGIHTLIANIYAAADRWEEVTRVRRKMKDLAVKKTPGCSSIEVNGNIREFLVGDTSHPETKDIYSVLSNLSRFMDSEEKLDAEKRLTGTIM